jgi:SepF-like predicted cell division protein (DUF552 family)
VVFEGLFKKGEKEENKDEFLELDENKFNESQEVSIRVETLGGFSDTDRIQGLVREGNVVILRTKQLRSNDIGELKKAVDKLKKTCTAMNGDIVGVSDDFLIITPPTVSIYRGREI